MTTVKERGWKSVLRKRKGLASPQEQLISQMVSLPQTRAVQRVTCDSQKHPFSLHYRKGTCLKVWRFPRYPLLWNPMMNFGALMAMETPPHSEEEVSWMSPLLNNVTIWSWIMFQTIPVFIYFLTAKMYLGCPLGQNATQYLQHALSSVSTPILSSSNNFDKILLPWNPRFPWNHPLRNNLSK